MYNDLDLPQLLKRIDNEPNMTTDEKQQLKQLATVIDNISSRGLAEKFGPIIGAILHPVTAWLLTK